MNKIKKIAILGGLVFFCSVESCNFKTSNISIKTSNTITVLDAEMEYSPKTTKSRKKYIKRFVRVAVLEMKRYGIPASISIAQGILESNAGGSRLCLVQNNHFGIKKGGKYRWYKSAWDSWRHHSEVLSVKYKHLQGGTVEDWAQGLQDAGYAKDSSYASQLLDIIRICELKKFDNI
jgi:flagellum-specific peptidoglycan hydrolase FlgJ